MPFYRKRFGAYRKKRFGRKRRYARKRGTFGTALGLAKKAWGMAKFVRSLVNVERKVWDLTYAAQSVPANGLASALHLIPQGDTQTTRDGNECKATTMSMRLHFTYNSTGSAQQQRIRMLLFKDMQFLPGGSTPTLTNLLEVSSNIQSPLNIVGSNAGLRFQILKDHIFTLEPTMKPSIDVKYFMRLNEHLHYVGVNGTDIVSPVYYLMLFSDQATNTPTADLYCRTRFIDN